jgi:hypothetical protein
MVWKINIENGPFQQVFGGKIGGRWLIAGFIS